MNSTAASAESSISTPPLDSRLWRGLLLTLIVLGCFPFWMFQHIPSQDGPSHLHNAVVLAQYGAEPLYQEYYEIKLFPAIGNVSTQYLLAFLVKVAGPQLAEKFLVSAYVISFYLAFIYFIRGLTPYACYFSLFAGILAQNFFFYMGFWNFCYSTVLLLLIVGYWARQQRRGTNWAPGPLIVMLIAGVMLYATHAVSWVVCCMAVAALGAPRLLTSVLGQWRVSRSISPASVLRSAFHWALPLGCLLPPSSLLLAHMFSSKGESACPAGPPVRERIWSLYRLSFLQVVPGDITFTKVVAGIIVIALLFLLASMLRQRAYNYWSSSLLFLSGACGMIAVFGPDCIGAGTFIQKRLGLYCFIFFLAWIASAIRNWPRPALNIVSALALGAALFTFSVRFPVFSKWNDELTSVARVGQDIRPRSTVLALCLDRRRQEVYPLKHAAGLFSQKIIVDLSNYEASSDYFTTAFQPEYSPFPALGAITQLEGVPPEFDIVRYEAQTKGRVDYVLLHWDTNDGGHAVEPLETGLMRTRLAAYTLVRSERSGKLNLRLYRSKRLEAGAAP